MKAQEKDAPGMHMSVGMDQLALLRKILLDFEDAIMEVPLAGSPGGQDKRRSACSVFGS